MLCIIKRATSPQAMTRRWTATCHRLCIAKTLVDNMHMVDDKKRVKLCEEDEAIHKNLPISSTKASANLMHLAFKRASTSHERDI